MDQNVDALQRVLGSNEGDLRVEQGERDWR